MTEKQELIEILKAIAFSDIRNYLDYGPKELRPRSIAEIDPGKLHALKTYWGGKSHKSFCIRLNDKVKALAMLLKISENHRPKMFLTNGV